MPAKRKSQPLPSPNGKPQKKQARKKPAPEASETRPAPAAERVTEAPPAAAPKRTTGKIVTRYVYTDEIGKTLFRVNRTDNKHFFQEHLDAQGKWIKGLGEVRRVLYRLEDLCLNPDNVVVLVEGEKDADTMAGLGFVATTSPMGAGKWRTEYSESLRDREVYLFPDNDAVGRTHMETVRVQLAGIARKVVIVPMPEGDAKDVSDLHAAGHDRTKFLELMRAAELAAPRPAVDRSRIRSTSKEGPGTVDRNGKSHLWQVVREKFSDIKPEQLHWLWPNVWLDRAVNLLTGAPGLGKTFVACDLAARVSIGARWPDDCGNAPIGDVIYMSAEDSYASVLVNRVAAAGGNLERLHTWTHKETVKSDGAKDKAELSLEDVDYMAANIEDLPDLKLVIFDPVTSYLGSADANDNAEVRRVLGKLVELAETRQFTVLLITHDKKMNVAAINSPMGSTAFAALPRVVQGLYRDAVDEEKKKRVLSPIKNNHGPDRFSRTFTIVSPTEDARRSKIVWSEGLDDRSADEVRAENEKLRAGYGKDYGEDDTAKKRQTKLLQRLDEMSKEPGEWIPSRRIGDSLNMGGGVFKATIYELVQAGILEENDVDRQLPNGGVLNRGQKAVRRISFVRSFEAPNERTN